MCRITSRAALPVLLVWANLAGPHLPAQTPVSMRAGETIVIPKSTKPLPLGQDVSGEARARWPEAWYRVDFGDQGEAKSLVVDLEIHVDARGDVDLEIYDAAGNGLAYSGGTTDRERCLLPIEDLERAYVRVYLYGEPDELRSDQVAAEYTLRAELSPRETVRGLDAFIDDLPPLPDGETVAGRLPARGSESPDRRLYLIDLTGVEATVARVVMEIANPDECDVDLDMCADNGDQLASSTGTGTREVCFVPLEGQERLFAVAYLGNPGQPQSGRYELRLQLSNEEPGLLVMERVEQVGVKQFVPGQRALGQVTEDRKEFFAWLYQPDEPAGAIVLNPADEAARPKLTVRNSDGWIVAEAEEAAGIRQVSLGGIEESYLLVHVTGDEPCGFSLCASVMAAAVPFDPGSAQPLAIGTPTTGTVGGEAGSVAVFRLQAPLTGPPPEVQLQADPIFADLDLLVCTAPGVVIARSTNHGGLETAQVPLGGIAPVYLVVTAREGVSAGFELSVE